MYNIGIGLLQFGGVIFGLLCLAAAVVYLIPEEDEDWYSDLGAEIDDHDGPPVDYVRRRHDH
jgi:hypothetical protein